MVFKPWQIKWKQLFCGENHLLTSSNPLDIILEGWLFNKLVKLHVCLYICTFKFLQKHTVCVYKFHKMCKFVSFSFFINAMLLVVFTLSKFAFFFVLCKCSVIGYIYTFVLKCDAPRLVPHSIHGPQKEVTWITPLPRGPQAVTLPCLMCTSMFPFSCPAILLVVVTISNKHFGLINTGQRRLEGIKQ
jgi:hypothetical protein